MAHERLLSLKQALTPVAGAQLSTSSGGTSTRYGCCYALGSLHLQVKAVCTAGIRCDFG